MNNLYLKLAEMNLWANTEFRNSMKNIEQKELRIKTPYGTLVDLVIHLFNAVNHWLDIIDNKYKFQRKGPKIDYNDWLQVLTLWKKTDQRLIQVIKSNNVNLTKFLPQHKMTLGEMFLHISHHSYYHRGQLALLYRQNNLQTVKSTDANEYFLIINQ
ncbi:MAG: DinB family protein [Candidatus Hodarchaeales archaeon]|jgi:uncharacterized damage-inducible protein DinB